MHDRTIESAVRDGVMRTTAVIALGAVALIHLLDAPGNFQESPYVGWLYVPLILGCVVAAAALVRTSDPRAWGAAAVLALAPLVAFILSRTVGLPQKAGDVGNWTEQLGLASVFVEGSLVALSVAALAPTGALRRTVRRRRPDTATA